MNDWALTIASNICVASLLAIGAFVVGLRARYCAVAHVLWLAVFVKLISPPLFDVPFPFPALLYDHIASRFEILTHAREAAMVDRRPSPLATNAMALQSMPNGNLVAWDKSSPLVFQESRTLTYWPRVIVWGIVSVWVTGALFLLWRGAYRLIRFTRLIHSQAETDPHSGLMASELIESVSARRASEPVTDSVGGRSSLTGQSNDPLAGASSCFFVRRGLFRRAIPPVAQISADLSPMLLGIGRWTVIVCPKKLWLNMSDVRRRAFIAHELSHFLRRDHWVRWIEWIVSSIYWWLPLTYFARKQLERNEEMACDQWVLSRFAVKKRDYAETLFQVAEYLDDSQLRSQRLTSRMQPTDLLEQRVCHVMDSTSTVVAGGGIVWLAYALIVCGLLVHLTPYRLTSANLPNLPVITTATTANELDSPLDRSSLSEPSVSQDTLNLPLAPRGWWHSRPTQHWASFAFENSGVRMQAESGERLQVQLSEGRQLTFRLAHPSRPTLLDNQNQLDAPARGSPDNQSQLDAPKSDSLTMTACVEVPGDCRFVVSDELGHLRLWDWKNGQPISLIGKHSAGICSLAFHSSTGLVAADAQGSVIRWDYDSGAPTATWTTRLGPIQTIRWSQAGDRVAVLLGNWSDGDSERQLHVLDAANMEIEFSRALPAATAMVWEDVQLGWLVVDWHGSVRTLVGEELTVVAKSTVSAYVLSQDAISTLDASIPLRSLPR